MAVTINVHVEERVQRTSRNASAPLRAIDPIPNQPVAVLAPAADSARDHSVDHDGSAEVFRVKNVGVLVCDEGVTLTRRERSHAQRFRVALVLEEALEVFSVDGSE